jgi:hypothetical protein
MKYVTCVKSLQLKIGIVTIPRIQMSTLESCHIVHSTELCDILCVLLITVHLIDTFLTMYKSSVFVNDDIRLYGIQIKCIYFSNSTLAGAFYIIL